MERSVRLEPARAEDAEAMLRVHRAAVHGTAAPFYDREIIEDWGSPGPANVERLARRIACGHEVAVVARDASGHLIGFGSILPSAGELHGLYVAPEHGRSGIGGMILKELEVGARQRGLEELSVDASPQRRGVLPASRV